MLMICILTPSGHHPVFLSLNSSQGTLSWGAAVDNCLLLQHPLLTEMTSEILIPKQRLRRRLKVELSCRSVALLCPSLCDCKECIIQASLSFTISHSLLKFMSIELVMPSNHLILCQSLLLLPSIFPRICFFFPA